MTTTPERDAPKLTKIETFIRTRFPKTLTYVFTPKNGHLLLQPASKTEEDMDQFVIDNIGALQLLRKEYIVQRMPFSILLTPRSSFRYIVPTLLRGAIALAFLLLAIYFTAALLIKQFNLGWSNIFCSLETPDLNYCILLPHQLEHYIGNIRDKLV